VTAAPTTDAELLDALLTRFGACTEDEVAWALSWDRARVLCAADDLAARLAPGGARRLAWDDLELRLEVPDEVLPQYARERLEQARSSGLPLSVIEAQRLIDLIHETLFGRARRNRVQPVHADRLGIVEALLVGDFEGTATADEIEVPFEGRRVAHPDVLYALQLVDTPAVARGERQPPAPAPPASTTGEAAHDDHRGGQPAPPDTHRAAHAATPS
jgi:hypothetical protein